MPVDQSSRQFHVGTQPSFDEPYMQIDESSSWHSPQRNVTPSLESSSRSHLPTSGSSCRPCRVVVEDVTDEDETLLEPEPEGIYDSLGGPEDSEAEDEAFLDDDEPDEFSRAAEKRDACLPEHLRGLSASQILESDWKARAFSQGMDIIGLLS